MGRSERTEADRFTDAAGNLALQKSRKAAEFCPRCFHNRLTFSKQKKRGKSNLLKLALPFSLFSGEL